MLKMDLNQIKEFIVQGNLHAFYVSPEWRRLRREVLAEDKGECQICKAKGRYKPASHVHHVNYLRKHPELALSKTYRDDDGILKRNLISVCKECHETVCHPARLPYHGTKPKPLTEERW